MTIVDGFKVAKTAWFISLEALLNLCIGLDFGARVKLVGIRRYFRNPSTNHLRWWHIFDAIVVMVCIILFAAQLFARSGAVKGFEEASEEALLVLWAIWQTLRMINIAKKQRQAQQSAKTLIDFSNVMVDTDFGGAVSYRMGGGSDGESPAPDDIIFGDLDGPSATS